jgi:hypothetical protein
MASVPPGGLTPSRLRIFKLESNTMRAMICSILVLGSLGFAVCGPQAATVYLWTDDEDHMHITDDKPPANGTLQDMIEYEPAPMPVTQPQKPPPAEADNADLEARCRDLVKARRTLEETKDVAVAVRERAEEARDKLENLRNRVGFDHDELDDFKDDLRRLERSARWAEMFAKQADLDVQVAELQVKLIETEVDQDCDEVY